MFVINKDLHQNINAMCCFAEVSLDILISKNPKLVTDKEYYLYFYIKSDLKMSIQYLSTLNIDSAIVIDFMVIWRNIRHSIESLYDLYNLTKDTDYFSVLEYTSKLSKHYNPKYRDFALKHKNFTIMSKKNIAEELYNFKLSYKGNCENLLKLSKISNSYIHPNVFIDIPAMQDIQSKANLLIDVLDSYIDIFNFAYALILDKYNDGYCPILSCTMCKNLYNKNCADCYKNNYIASKNALKEPFKNIVVSNIYSF